MKEFIENILQIIKLVLVDGFYGIIKTILTAIGIPEIVIQIGIAILIILIIIKFLKYLFAWR